MELDDVLDYLACPDCSGEIKYFRGNYGETLLCNTCVLVFPVVEGVIIVLDKKSRNKELETPAITTLHQQADSEELRVACENTLKLLGSVDQSSAYAWEDEIHWSDAYQRQLEQSKQKNWNDRFWQREPLFRLAQESLSGSEAGRPRVIVDLGCGEGQDFRHFLANKLRADDIYIGLDISLPGLLLNRANNTHSRALYVLGSADRPPLKPRIADVIISLGTLHHMETKEEGLPILQNLLRTGVMVLSDPINGQFLPPYLRFSRASRSVHDDSLDIDQFNKLVMKSNLKVLYERQISGIVYFLLFKAFRPVILRSKLLHGLVHSIDDLFTKTLGRWFGLFKPKGLLLVLGYD